MKYKTYILLPMVLNLFDAVINKTTSSRWLWPGPAWRPP